MSNWRGANPLYFPTVKPAIKSTWKPKGVRCAEFNCEAVLSFSAAKQNSRCRQHLAAYARKQSLMYGGWDGLEMKSDA